MASKKITARSNTGKSGSDLAGHPGTVTKVAAGVKGMDGKGVEGSRLASAFILDAQASAEKIVKDQISMKDRLRKLEKLTVEGHVEFRATMQAKIEAIKAEASGAGYESFNDYRKNSDNGRIANIVQATVSMWVKMSDRVQRGFKPDYKTGWAEISKAATDFNPQAASTPTMPQSETERKAAEVLAQAAMVKKTADGIRNNLGIKEGQEIPLATKSVIPDVVRATCLHCEVEELEAIIVMLQGMIEAKASVREAAAKATAKASASAAQGTKPAAPGRNVDQLIEAGKEATAPTARGNRRNERAHATR